ncbi:hypothetical protein KIN_39070 [Litoreibacter roseus]|uniref:Uncharacterized protein n=1 Tax=Litoreibacter roseus TaxID=2601869 RepID=A0A6N6JKI7_9RHOB|nr:hypothetical protein KIN_39070 [Litoreibacter roseus]
MSEIDPKGLMADAYQIDGIGISECRTIFLDWALGVPAGQDPRAAIEQLLVFYGTDAPDHPMTEVLKAGLAEQPEARRRGGRAARLSDRQG